MSAESAPIHNANEARTRSPEEKAEQMRCLLSEIASSINGEFAPYLPEELRASGFVDATGAIRDNAYLEKYGGPTTKEEAIERRKIVYKRDVNFSGADNESIHSFYKKKYHISSQKEHVEVWRKEGLKRNGSLAEMAITILLHKFLKDDFYVLRSNAYDDHVHGADNLIIEKATGAVVATFDEYLGEDTDEQYVKKLAREHSHARREGTTITYGIQAQQNKEGVRQLQRTAVHHLPTFALRISKDELSALIDDLGETLDSVGGDASTHMFSHLITSLDEQAHAMQKLVRANSPVRARIEEFMGALERIQERVGTVPASRN